MRWIAQARKRAGQRGMARIAHRIIVLMGAIFVSCLAHRATAQASGRTWQLVFTYSPSGFSLDSASPIPPSAKTPQTPGLAGAPGIVEYDLKWIGPDDKVLLQSQFEAPFGVRGPMTKGAACEVSYPEDGVFVVRVPGPDPASQIKNVELTLGRKLKSNGGNLPAVTNISKAIIPFTGSCSSSNSSGQGPTGVTLIRDTGPAGSRLNFVVLGDGFRQADLDSGSFANATDAVVAAFGAKSPWNEYFPGVNVSRIDVISSQSGMDTPSGNVTTFFNSSLVTDRLIVVDNTGSRRAICAADQLVGVGMWDQILLLVNTPTYGGSGGQIAVASLDSYSAEIMIHEVGHSFAGLADEYSDPYPGYPAGDSEPNVDYDGSGPGLKWLVWVESGTPLPTPDDLQYFGVVGAFEGARYKPTGIYRPWQFCEMRYLDSEFCPVCKEAHVRRFHTLMPLIDGQSPPGGATVEVPAGGQEFQVLAPAYGSYQYTWRLNGQDLGGSGPILHLSPSQVTQSPQSLAVTVTDATAFVRQETFTQTYGWNVFGAPPQVTRRMVVDALLGFGAVDPGLDLNSDFQVDIADVIVAPN